MTWDPTREIVKSSDLKSGFRDLRSVLKTASFAFLKSASRQLEALPAPQGTCRDARAFAAR